MELTDIEACIVAIEDGNPWVALEILQEIRDSLEEEEG